MADLASPRRVRVGFSRGRSLISKAICRLTGSAVSHTFFLYNSQDFEQEMVLHAWFNGFGPMSLERFRAMGNEVMDVVDPIVPLDEALIHAADWFTELYDYPGILGMLPVLALRALGRRLCNPLHAPGALFCSEAVSLGLKLCGYPGSEQLDPPTVTPGGLNTFMRASRKRMKS